MVEPYTNILTNAKLKTGKRQKTAEREKSIKEEDEEEEEIGFKSGSLFFLKMVHLCRNMSVMRFQYWY